MKQKKGSAGNKAYAGIRLVGIDKGHLIKGMPMASKGEKLFWLSPRGRLIRADIAGKVKHAKKGGPKHGLLKLTRR